jgi:tetratricopeptide (TPR) repeat protein
MKLNTLNRTLAKDVIDDAIKKHPEDSDLFNCRAMMNYHNGELTEAVVDYSSAIRVASEPLENYYLYRGEIYLELLKYDQAIEDFNEALKSSPCQFNQPYLFFNRAKAYVEKGESEKAALDIRRAIRLNPDEENFHRLAATIIPRGGAVGP